MLLCDSLYGAFRLALLIKVLDYINIIIVIVIIIIIIIIKDDNNNIFIIAIVAHAACVIIVVVVAMKTGLTVYAGLQWPTTSHQLCHL